MNDPKRSLDNKSNPSNSNSNDTGQASGDRTLRWQSQPKNNRDPIRALIPTM